MDPSKPLPPPPPTRWLRRKTPEFWAKLVSVFDQKDQWATNNNGFGRFSVEIVYYNGKLVDILWTDKVSDKPLIDEAQEMLPDSPLITDVKK